MRKSGGKSMSKSGSKSGSKLDGMSRIDFQMKLVHTQINEEALSRIWQSVEMSNWRLVFLRVWTLVDGQVSQEGGLEEVRRNSALRK